LATINPLKFKNRIFAFSCRISIKQKTDLSSEFREKVSALTGGKLCSIQLLSFDASWIQFSDSVAERKKKGLLGLG